MSRARLFSHWSSSTQLLAFWSPDTARVQDFRSASTSGTLHLAIPRGHLCSCCPNVGLTVWEPRVKVERVSRRRTPTLGITRARADRLVRRGAGLMQVREIMNTKVVTIRPKEAA